MQKANLKYLDKHCLPSCSEKLEDLEESCFSADFDPYYQTHIDEFRNAYLALNLPFTTKVRILSYNGRVRKGCTLKPEIRNSKASNLREPLIYYQSCPS